MRDVPATQQSIAGMARSYRSATIPLPLRRAELARLTPRAGCDAPSKLSSTCGRSYEPLNPTAANRSRKKSCSMPYARLAASGW